MHAHESSVNRREMLTLMTAGVLAGGAPGWGYQSDAAAWADTPDPTALPCLAYPEVPGISCETFRLPVEGLSEVDRQAALRQLLAYQSHRQAKTLGFQANQNFSYQGDLKPFLDFHINNVGDPFQSGSFTLNSKWMERAVLDYYARLWNARWPHDLSDPESYWGYVLTMGSTEGNLYGLWNGRDYLAGKCLLADPDAEQTAAAASQGGCLQCVPQRIVYQQAEPPADNPNAFRPVAFYSEDTHYSIIKAVCVLGIQTFYEVGTQEYPNQCPITADKKWPKEVPSVGGGGGPGCIDVDALVQLVQFFAAKGHPILVNFNYGTTFKGAYDDVEEAGKRLLPILERHGLGERTIEYPGGEKVMRNGYWFHVDAALAGSYMPFIEKAHAAGRLAQRGPNFDFRLPFVNSVVTSGHKWIGSPWPCGVYMSKTKYLMLPPSRPNYIGSPDSTLAGSRNGFSAMILWDYLAKHSYERQIDKAVRLEELAEYACQRLKELESKQGPLWVSRTPLSLTLRFKQANHQISFKYSLASENLYLEGQLRPFSHIYIMEHVTRELIDELVSDLSKPGAFAQRQQPAGGQPRSVQRQIAGRRQPPTGENAADNPPLEGARVVAATQPLVYVPDFGRGMK